AVLQRWRLQPASLSTFAGLDTMPRSPRSRHFVLRAWSRTWQSIPLTICGKLFVAPYEIVQSITPFQKFSSKLCSHNPDDTSAWQLPNTSRRFGNEITLSLQQTRENLAGIVVHRGYRAGVEHGRAGATRSRPPSTLPPGSRPSLPAPRPRPGL